MKLLLTCDPIAPTASWTDEVVYETFKHDPMISLPPAIIEQCVRYMKSKCRK